MIRRLALASSVALLALPLSARSRGLPVIDSASIGNQIAEHAETLARWGSQLSAMEAQLQRLMATYQAITGVRDMGSAMAALNMVGIQNPMPVNPYAVQNLISGTGGISGMSSALSGLYTGNASANHVYTPSGGDWRAQDLMTNANSLAGIQALAQHSYQASADRLTQLAVLRARAQIASDPAEVSQLQAQTAIVQSDIASQQQQLQAVAVMAQTQQQVRAQRTDEQDRRCVEALIAFYNGSGSGGCPAPSASVSNVMATGTNLIGGGGAASAGGSTASLETMTGQSWGQQAVDNASGLGVNPNAVAATCVLESGCQNVSARAGSTVNGAFQMTDGTYQAAMRAAGQSTDLAGKMNPATESIAAAQELKTAALTLQQSGIANPTVMDVRGAYNFGQGYGVALARADNSTPMSSVLSSYSAATLQGNGITPGVTTVGQWRAGIAGKLGNAATAPVLLGLKST